MPRSNCVHATAAKMRLDGNLRCSFYPATEQLMHPKASERSVSSASTSGVENMPGDKHVCLCWCTGSLLSLCSPIQLPFLSFLPPRRRSMPRLYCMRMGGERVREGGRGRKARVCVWDSMSVVLCLSRASVSSPEGRSSWSTGPRQGLVALVLIPLSQNPLLTESLGFTQITSRTFYLIPNLCPSSLWNTICTEPVFLVRRT